MNNNVMFGTCFLLGAGAGLTVGWLYFKKKYEQFANDEIEDVKNLYEKRLKRLEEEGKKTVVYIQDKVAETEDLHIGWKKPASEDDDEDSIPVEYGKAFKNKELFRLPYVITPEEFYEDDEFEKITLTYYGRDHILADEDHNMVEDIESAVGNDWEGRFSEYVQNVVYVRNDARQCNYEILFTDAGYLDEF